METKSKRARYLAAAAVAMICCVVLLCISAASGPPRKVADVAELARHIRTANEKSDSVYAGQVNAWRRFMREARSQQRLEAFVDDLIGLEHKFKQGIEFVSAGDDRNRVQGLFRERVLDERKVADDMEATVKAYEQMLFEQDRPILAAAGISPEQWSQRIQTQRPNISHWRKALTPVVSRAVGEARRDAARFVATTIAADFAGDGIKSAARRAGLDKTKEGGWGDLLSGLVIDFGASVAIDSLTDATDDIVAGLGKEMATAESTLLDGEQGLFAVLRRIRALHVAERNSLLTAAQSR